MPSIVSVFAIRVRVYRARKPMQQIREAHGIHPLLQIHRIRGTTLLLQRIRRVHGTRPLLRARGRHRIRHNHLITPDQAIENEEDLICILVLMVKYFVIYPRIISRTDNAFDLFSPIEWERHFSSGVRFLTFHWISIDLFVCSAFLSRVMIAFLSLTSFVMTPLNDLNVRFLLHKLRLHPSSSSATSQEFSLLVSRSRQFTFSSLFSVQFAQWKNKKKHSKKT